MHANGLPFISFCLYTPSTHTTMICQRCLQRLSKRSSSRVLTNTTTTTRTYSTPVTAQTTTSTNPRPQGRPAATVTPGTTQPFSTPLTPRASKSEGKTTTTKFPASSVPAGTVLKGLNFMKNAQDPVAMEDREYPDWLWGVLEKKKEGKEGGVGGVGGGEVEGDLFAKSKKQRQRAAKALRKIQAMNPESLTPKVPVYEQSVDLPAGDGSVEGAMEAGGKRGELTSAMRDQRRKKIKEDNYLRGMR